MARTNLAYKNEEARQSYSAEPIALPRPELRTVEGKVSDAQTRTQHVPWTRTVAVMSAVLVIVLASVSIGRVSIANATVRMMQGSGQVSNAIAQARAAGLELEVQYSLANNPTRVQDAAAAMGILPSSQPETLAAHSGFGSDFLDRMRLAAEETRAAEITSLSSALLTTPEVAEVEQEDTTSDASQVLDGQDSVTEGTS